MNMKKFLQTIFSIKNENLHKVVRILGLKIKITNENKLLLKNIQNLYYKQKSNLEASVVHPATFGKYKNLYKDKSIVIVGCGPSAIHYKPLNDVIHIGVNRAYQLKDIILDFMFAVENFPDDNEIQEMCNYRQEECTKFFLKQPEGLKTRNEFKNKHIKYYHYRNSSVKEYIAQDEWCYNWALNIEYEPLYIGLSTVFQALQFALFSGTKNIYLVGCDCSNDGHFHKEKDLNASDLTSIYPDWLSFKNHVENNYPDTKIISINPVNLKGMFNDIYTQSYLDEHPELLNEKVEILK